MIHVVHLLHELMPSGAETMLAVAGLQWAQHGVRCTVLATGPRQGPYAQALAAAGYGVDHLPVDRSLGRLLALRRWLRTHKVDCLHVHKESNAFHYVLAAIGVVTRVVCTHHSVFQFAGRVRLRRSIERRLGRLIGVRHIAIGESVQANEWTRFHNRTETIHNWYDPTRFFPTATQGRAQARAALGLADGQLAILSVGNCAPVKNHDAIVRALTRPALAGLVYVHAGAEDEQYGERALATQLGVENRTRFLGPRTDVDQLLAACDGYVMPSLREGLPISALEALVSGVPCLLTDAPGLRDFKPYAPLVQWCQPTDDSVAETLASWMPQLTPELRARCAAQAATVANAYSMERGVAAYVAAYKGLPLTGADHD